MRSRRLHGGSEDSLDRQSSRGLARKRNGRYQRVTAVGDGARPIYGLYMAYIYGPPLRPGGQREVVIQAASLPWEGE